MNIYVGNLPKQVTEESLRTLFEKHGEVKEVKLIRDFDSGELRGFGFIQMSDSEGRIAIESINGLDFDGSKLTVNEARPKKDRPRTGGAGRGDRRGDSRGGRSRY